MTTIDAAASGNPLPGGRAGTRTSPTARGRPFARTCLVAAGAAAPTLGVSGYAALAAVDLTSTHPFAVALGWLVLAKLAALACLITVGLSMLACIVCRPRAGALVALAASVVLPVLSVSLAVALGVQALESHVSADLHAIAGTAATTIDVLESWGIEVQPARDLLEVVPGAGR